ncbi:MULTISPECIES: hypothetical protein [Pseudomonas syringae group]|uniref:Uncharacterized protein n=4 Tax=Pseudomonas syringae group TaxID=136849 RepID=A0AAD0DWF5_9PSED|nr:MULTISPECIES: hypothetical protein [Pseudomonas syringae group]AVB17888.1 hypothetical protein BKM03_00220 [Pseudomonas avellanae]EGH10542.1 hypothetical protein PSYMP_13954 [Pseudomonas amygdali pv. morsprunorum str. M302280]KWS66926.1 hypothetical protein AL055_20255 [Pseudomonas amygdali pv. morsprunorum]PHN41164.1 hypothetical protein AO261_10735 [Pseudomonas avellanae]POC84003.1 hypothetical protein BKM26_24320 [Pseudomonas avellanae]
MSKWDVLVEATLESIHVFSIEKQVRIRVTSPWEGKKCYQIVVKGIDKFVLNDMRILNIIDRVNFFGFSKEQEAETANYLFFLLRGRDAKKGELKDSTFLQKLELVRAGKLVLFELEAVCGATFIALSESVSLELLDTI